MTVPDGAKVIKNKFAHRCFACKAMVGAEDGAAILDVNITGKWETFHTGCLPAPYEAADIHESHPYNGARRTFHARCATCQHWESDHVGGTGHCTSTFKGACSCSGWVTNTQPLNRLTVQPQIIAIPATPQPLPTLGGLAATAQATQPGNYRGSIPLDDTSFRLVVFYGNIHSATDGDTHFVSANSVLELHGITPDLRVTLNVPVEYVSQDAKRLYRPRSGDFIIGPRYYGSEYDDAKVALRERLEQEGFI